MLHVWTLNGGYPRRLRLSFSNTTYNFITSKFLIRSGDPQVFVFTVTKMPENTVGAAKLEGKLQIAKKLI